MMLFSKAKKLLSKHTFIFILFLLIAFPLFASQKLFSDKFYTSHDGGGHVIRMIEFDESIREGQIPVRIAKRINYGMGYPFFNFNYPLIYYMGEAFHLTGLSFVDSFKALMILSMIVGSIGMYVLALPYFGMIGALVSSIFFTIAPYKFLNMYVRGNVAESFGLALIPFALWAVDNFVKGGKYKYPFLIFTVSALILSHNITALIGITFCIVFFFIRIQKLEEKGKLVRQIAILFIISLLLTAFFWVPVIIESKLTKLVELTEDYKNFFPTFSEIIYSPWGFGAFKQTDFPGKMSPQVGLIHTLVVFIALMIYIIKAVDEKVSTKKNSPVFFFLLIFFVSLVLTLPISKILWDFIYPLKLVQIPWRFVGYMTLGASFAAGFVLSQIHPGRFRLIITFVLLALLLYANRNHIRVNQYISFESPFIEADVYGPSTTSRDEHMPRLAGRIFEAPSRNGDLVASDSGISKREVWKSNYHRFTVEAKYATSFRDNTWVFPGWTAQVDDQATPLEKDNRLKVALLPGKHTVEFLFGETWYRLMADTTSIFTLISFTCFLAWKRKKLL